MILNRRQGLNATVMVLMCLMVSSKAWSTTILGSANPGVMLKDVETTSPQPKASTPKFSMPTRPPMNAPVGNMKLALTRFNITGNTVFSTQSLNHLVADMAGTKVAFADMLRAANKITNFYRDAGYLVARAYVPEQEIQEGVIEIAVLEGLVGIVNVNNEAGLSGKLVNRHIDVMKPGTVVSRKNVERAMLLLNDLPGVEAAAIFKIGKETGTTDVDVDLKKTRRISGNIDLNNFGSDFTGEARLGVTININNPLGLGDSLGFRLLASENTDTFYGSVNYSMSISPSGARLGIRYSSLDSDIGEQFEILDLESEAETWGIYLSYPFTRSRGLNVIGQISVENRDVQQMFGGALAPSSSQDDINAVVVALTGDYRDSLMGGGISSYGLAFQRGIKSLGDEFQSSRIDADGEFTKYNLTYSRLQFIGAKTSLLLKFSGQFTDDALVSSEQISLGGPNAVRAYLSGEGLADSGLVITAELRRNLPFSNGFIKNAQLFTFYDYGQGKINSAAINIDDNFDRQSLGVGIKLGVVGNYQINFTFADAMAGEALTDDDDRQYLIHAIKWFD